MVTSICDHKLPLVINGYTRGVVKQPIFISSRSEMKAE